MKKLRIEDIWLIGILTFCLALACIGLTSVPNAKNGPGDYHGYPTSKSPDNPNVGLTSLSVQHAAGCAPSKYGCGNSPAKDWFSWVEGNSGGLQSLFDLTLVFVGVLQWWIYRTIRNDSVAKERAFVFVKVLDMANTIPGMSHIISVDLSPKWENGGSTPALHVHLQVNVEIREDDLPNDFDFPDRWNEGEDRTRHPVFLAPKATTNGSPRTIPGNIIPLIFAKQKQAFIYGWAEYDDVFTKQRRRTEFCYKLVVPNINPLTGQSYIQYLGYGRHNGVDGDCYRKPKPYVLNPHETPPF